MSSDTLDPIGVLNHVPLRAQVRVLLQDELRQQLVGHNTPDVSVELRECTYEVRWPDGPGLPPGEVQEAVRVLLRHLKTQGHVVQHHAVIDAPCGMAAPLTPAPFGPPAAVPPVTAPLVLPPSTWDPTPPRPAPPILTTSAPVQQELAGLLPPPSSTSELLKGEEPPAAPKNGNKLRREQKRWSDEEVALLRASTMEPPYDTLAATLERTVKAVEMKVMKLRAIDYAEKKAKDAN